MTPPALIAFPLMRRKALKEKRLWELTVQFKEAIWIVSGFLSAGMSVENAFEMSVPELMKLYGREAMIVKEFQAIVRGVKLNKPVEAMLNDFARRSSLPDIRNFAEVFSIAKRSGGSLKDIIERTGRIIRDKTAVTEEIKNMTASKRYEQNIMNILPFGIIIYINMTSNGFLDVMYESFTGRLIMTVCLMLIAGSYIISQKILDIKV
ncbi:MAG: type II secretion system F family protein [Eubacteriales bacterium]|nr:type II secretion system F family protein [Eubacteriales bacterium]